MMNEDRNGQYEQQYDDYQEQGGEYDQQYEEYDEESSEHYPQEAQYGYQQQPQQGDEERADALEVRQMIMALKALEQKKGAAKKGGMRTRTKLIIGAVVIVAMIIITAFVYMMPMKVKEAYKEGEYSPKLYGSIENRAHFTVELKDVSYEVKGNCLGSVLKGPVTEILRKEDRGLTKLEPGQTARFYVDLPSLKNTVEGTPRVQNHPLLQELPLLVQEREYGRLLRAQLLGLLCGFTVPSSVP